jgi:hypothetical protein
VPSAILTAAAPYRLAVYDRRARACLSILFDGRIPPRYTYSATWKPSIICGSRGRRTGPTATWTWPCICWVANKNLCGRVRLHLHSNPIEDKHADGFGRHTWVTSIPMRRDALDELTP